ncbi:hypothetical protein PG999_011018 [Apiospora kogelbergensis]|uniref:Alpha-acetolactate decarboxylase n=1 Tax=Apiospora kogelbergensis TaxID=1337665 RepID=A0AAW0QEH0_9PEZI
MTYTSTPSGPPSRPVSNEGGPRVADLTNHGTYGVGVFERSPADSSSTGESEALPFETPPKEMVQIESKAYSIAYDGSVTEADLGASLPYAMVTVFQPTQRLELNSCFTLADLQKVGWPNSPMPFRITGAFRSVHTKSGLYEDVEGVIFGFMIPKWQATVSGDAYSQMRFIDDDRKQGGGNVLGFETAEGVLLETGACGRFHLGFPQDKLFNELKFSV